MKKLFILAFAIMMLSACSNPLQKDASEETLTGDAQSEQTDDTVMGEGMEEELVEDMIIDTELTKEFSCNSLKDSLNVQSCKNEVNRIIAEMLQNEIVSSYDLNRCDSLDGYMIEDCKAVIQESGITGPISKEDRLALDNAIYGFFGDVMESDSENAEDVSVGCDTLSASNGLQAYCKKEIQKRADEEKLWGIVMDGSKADCAELVSESVRTQCESEFDIQDSMEAMEEMDTMDDMNMEEIEPVEEVEMMDEMESENIDEEMPEEIVESEV